MWYWLFKYVLIGPVLRLFGRPTIEGAEHIPPTGPVVLASNHLTVADSFFLVLMVRRRITFVAKSEYFTGTGLKGRLTRWFFSCTGQVPIDRSGAGAARGALATATGILEAGGVWGIYPEGSRSPDGRLHRGKTGVMRVALPTGAPVVPVVMRGTPAVNPIGSRIWRFGKVHITVCAPLDLAHHRTTVPSERTVREATDELMRTLLANSDQEYVDAYAAQRVGVSFPHETAPRSYPFR
ncbi:lysophospholipid acyltransferase family protein [Rhodococcus sp. NPDC055112]